MRLTRRELRLLEGLSHVNVVKLHSAFRSKSGRVYLVFEYCESTFAATAASFPRGLPLYMLKAVAWQLLHVVSYLHSHQIMHRDIKPANLLMNSHGVLKLCDFGFARHAAAHVADPLTTYTCTRWYRAPEVLVGVPYGMAVDMWSVGCTLAELAMGKPLFPGSTSADQLSLITACLGPLPPALAEAAGSSGRARRLERSALPTSAAQQQLQLQQQQARSKAGAGSGGGATLRQRLWALESGLVRIVESCLRLDPQRRLSASELLRSEWFGDIPWITRGTALANLYTGDPAAAAGLSVPPPSPPSRHTTATPVGLRADIAGLVARTHDAQPPPPQAHTRAHAAAAPPPPQWSHAPTAAAGPAQAAPGLPVTRAVHAAQLANDGPSSPWTTAGAAALGAAAAAAAAATAAAAAEDLQRTVQGASGGVEATGQVAAASVATSPWADSSRPAVFPLAEPGAAGSTMTAEQRRLRRQQQQQQQHEQQLLQHAAGGGGALHVTRAAPGAGVGAGSLSTAPLLQGTGWPQGHDGLCAARGPDGRPSAAAASASGPAAGAARPATAPGGAAQAGQACADGEGGSATGTNTAAPGGSSSFFNSSMLSGTSTCSASEGSKPQGARALLSPAVSALQSKPPDRSAAITAPDAAAGVGNPGAAAAREPPWRQATTGGVSDSDAAAGTHPAPSQPPHAQGLGSRTGSAPQVPQGAVAAAAPSGGAGAGGGGGAHWRVLPRRGISAMLPAWPERSSPGAAVTAPGAPPPPPLPPPPPPPQPPQPQPQQHARAALRAGLGIAAAAGGAPSTSTGGRSSWTFYRRSSTSMLGDTGFRWGERELPEGHAQKPSREVHGDEGAPSSMGWLSGRRLLAFFAGSGGGPGARTPATDAATTAAAVDARTTSRRSRYHRAADDFAASSAPHPRLSLETAARRAPIAHFNSGDLSPARAAAPPVWRVVPSRAAAAAAPALPADTQRDPHAQHSAAAAAVVPVSMLQLARASPQQMGSVTSGHTLLGPAVPPAVGMEGSGHRKRVERRSRSPVAPGLDGRAGGDGRPPSAAISSSAVVPISLASVASAHEHHGGSSGAVRVVHLTGGVTAESARNGDAGAAAAGSISGAGPRKRGGLLRALKKAVSRLSSKREQRGK